MGHWNDLQPLVTNIASIGRMDTRWMPHLCIYGMSTIFWVCIIYYQWETAQRWYQCVPQALLSPAIYLHYHRQWQTQIFSWGGTTSCDWSRHSVGEANLICFPVPHIYYFAGGEGSKSKDKLDGAIAEFPPPDPPLCQNTGYYVFHVFSFYE